MSLDGMEKNSHQNIPSESHHNSNNTALNSNEHSLVIYERYKHNFDKFSPVFMGDFSVGAGLDRHVRPFAAVPATRSDVSFQS